MDREKIVYLIRYLDGKEETIACDAMNWNHRMLWFQNEVGINDDLEMIKIINIDLISQVIFVGKE